MVQCGTWTLRIILVKLPSAANSESAAASPTKVLKMLTSIVPSRTVAAHFNTQEGTCGLSRINFRLFYFRKMTSRSPWGGTETAKAILRELGCYCKLRRQINRREREAKPLLAYFGPSPRRANLANANKSIWARWQIFQKFYKTRKWYIIIVEPDGF